MKFISAIKQDVINKAADFYLSGFRSRIKNETASWFVRRYPHCVQTANFNEKLADTLTRHFAEHIVEHPESFAFRLTYHGGGRFQQSRQKKTNYPFIDTLLSLKAIQAKPDKYKLHLIDDKRFFDLEASDRYGDLVPMSVVHDIKYIRTELKQYEQYSEGDVALAMLNTFNPVTFTFTGCWVTELDKRSHNKEDQRNKFYAEFEKILSPKGLNLAYRKEIIDWEQRIPRRLTHAFWRHALQNMVYIIFSEMGYKTPKSAIEDYFFIEKDIHMATNYESDPFSTSVNERVELIRKRVEELVGNTQLGRTKKLIPVTVEAVLQAFLKGLQAQRSDTIKTTGYYAKHAAHTVPIMKRIRRTIPKHLHDAFRKLAYIEWEAGPANGNTNALINAVSALKMLDIDISALQHLIDKLNNYAFYKAAQTHDTSKWHVITVLKGIELLATELNKPTSDGRAICSQQAIEHFISQLAYLFENEQKMDLQINSARLSNARLCIEMHTALAIYRTSGDITHWNTFTERFIDPPASTMSGSNFTKIRPQSTNIPIVLNDLAYFVSEEGDDLLPLFERVLDALIQYKSIFGDSRFTLFIPLTRIYHHYIKQDLDSYVAALVKKNILSLNMFSGTELEIGLESTIKTLTEMPLRKQHYFAKVLAGLYDQNEGTPEALTALLEMPFDKMAVSLNENDAPYALPYIKAYLKSEGIGPIDYLSVCPAWQQPLTMSLLSEGA